MSRALLAVAALSLAACGAGDGRDDSSSTTGSTAPSASATTSAATPPQPVDPRDGGLDVAFGEYAITLEAPAVRPGAVTFVVRNGGQLVHGFEMKIGGEGGSGSDGFELEADEFGPGETLQLDATLDVGTYEIECFVANHDDLGMRTTLEVREDAPLVVPDVSAAPGAVRIAGFAFDPGATQVEPGTEVVWTNDDPTAHTVTADGGTFDSGPIDPGLPFTTRLDEVGTYTYFCAIHPTMKGTIDVISPPG